MINEYITEYSRHIIVPNIKGIHELIIGPLNSDQYLLLLLIAKCNGFRWASYHSPLMWNNVEPYFYFRHNELPDVDGSQIHFNFAWNRITRLLVKDISYVIQDTKINTNYIKLDMIRFHEVCYDSRTITSPLANTRTNIKEFAIRSMC